MKKKTTRKNRISNTDSRIFGSLFKAQRPLPVKKIAKRIDVSWPTANQSINKLNKMGILDIQKSIRRTNVKINDDFLNKIRAKLKKKRKGYY